jgi:hypothetical protein
MHDRTAVDLPGVDEVVDEANDSYTTEHSDSCETSKSANIPKSAKAFQSVHIPQFIILASTFANSGKKLMTVENNM